MAAAANVTSKSPGLPAVVEVVEIDEEHVKGVASNMLFMVWRRETLPGSYRRGIRLAEQLGARFPEGIGICQILEVEAIAPGPETRRIFVELWRQAPVKHFSVTYEGSGFKAASIRAVVAGVHALGCRNCEHAVHKSARDAAEWHANQQALIGRSESPALIARIINTLRAQHREKYP